MLYGTYAMAQLCQKSYGFFFDRLVFFYRASWGFLGFGFDGVRGSEFGGWIEVIEFALGLGGDDRVVESPPATSPESPSPRPAYSPPESGPDGSRRSSLAIANPKPMPPEDFDRHRHG